MEAIPGTEQVTEPKLARRVVPFVQHQVPTMSQFPRAEQYKMCVMVSQFPVLIHGLRLNAIDIPVS